MRSWRRIEVSRAIRPLFTTLLPFAVLALAGCSRSGTDGAPDVPKGTPVVFISIDTLRADHLPAYGYTQVETPALEALRRDGILFERAYAVTPLTLPSHSSLLTGVLPAVHGVRDNVGYRLDAAKIGKGELPFLPEILKQAGYVTGAFVGARVLDSKWGLAQGFDRYADKFDLSHFFLAREEVDAGRLDQAAELSQRGLRVDPASELAPLGHYVLADVFNRKGDATQSRLELEKARRLEAALKRRAPPRI